MLLVLEFLSQLPDDLLALDPDEFLYLLNGNNTACPVSLTTLYKDVCGEVPVI